MERACTQDDLSIIRALKEVWQVSPDGSVNLNGFIAQDERAQFDRYECRGCWHRFDAWEDALEHLQIEDAEVQA